MIRLRDRAWSPYLTGALIGLLQVPAVLLLGTALGASSSYVTVSASIAEVFDPAIRSLAYAGKYLDGAKNWWQVALVGGIALGAFISAGLSGTRRSGASPIWSRALGTSNQGVRFALAFAGGFLLLLGARLADGCTSGHGISGMAQLAVSGFVAVTAMFAGGIAPAMLLRAVR